MNEQTAAAPPAPGAYPVQFDVEPQLAGRNRLTVAFRIILAIPHVLLVGAPGLTFYFGWPRNDEWNSAGIALSGDGVIGFAAFVAAVVAWFAILFARKHPRGIWDFGRFYMRWRANAVAYAALLRDEYPPFGDGAYPVTFTVEYPDGKRDLWSVGLRIFYAIPHLVVLFFLQIAFFVVTVIGWFAILFTGAYPEGLYRFATGVMRWSLRVDAYVLLLRDEYPPFSLEA